MFIGLSALPPHAVRGKAQGAAIHTVRHAGCQSGRAPSIMTGDLLLRGKLLNKQTSFGPSFISQQLIHSL
jgi:hypothetical protein